MKIKNKRQMYDLLIKGRLGNSIEMWRSVDELLASGFNGNITIRSLSVNDPLRIYNDPVTDALEQLWELNGLHRTDLVFGAAPPGDHRTLQGEVMRWQGGLYLRYNRLDMPMRTAFEHENLHAWGLEALMLLQASVDPATLAEFPELFDTYPGCVIEFSSYDKGAGRNPSRNTIIWEVRNY